MVPLGGAPVAPASESSVGDMTASVERALGAIRTIRAAGATRRETERVVGAATSAYRAGVDMAERSRT
jgi:hypothetical protein